MKIDYASFQEQFQQLHQQGCMPDVIKIAPADLMPLMESTPGYVPDNREPGPFSVHCIVDEVDRRVIPIWLEPEYAPGTSVIQWTEGVTHDQAH